MKSISLPLVAKAGGGAVAASGVIAGGILLHKHFEFPKGLDKELVAEKEASLSFSSESNGGGFSIDTTKQHEVTAKVKATSTKSDSKFTGDKWTCTIRGIAKAADSTTVTLTFANGSENFQKDEQKGKFENKFSASKEGFIKSCARNRTKEQNSNQDQLTSEIVLLLKKENDKWIFEEEHVNSVFAGTWVNPETK